MPNIRILLWAALAFILYLNYEAWMRDFPAPGAAGSTTSTAGAGTATSLRDAIPQAASSAQLPATPAVATPTAALATPPTSAALPASTTPPTSSTTPVPDAAPLEPLHVATDVLDVVINLKGGELDQADLLKYPLRKDAPNVPVRLLSSDPASLYLLQSGLLGAAGEAAPTHLAAWSSVEKS